MFEIQETQGTQRGRKPLDRRRLNDGMPRRVPGVGEMTEFHHEICRRLLLGQRNKEIAECLGCTPQTVSNVRNSPIVKHRLRELTVQRDVAAVNFSAEVQARAERAFKIVDEALNDETGEVPLMMRLKEANNILDRVERVEGIGQRNVHFHAHLTAEDIENLKQRALAVGATCGVLAQNEFSDASCIEVMASETCLEGGDYGGGSDS